MRRIRGPLADEVFLLFRPPAGADAAGQAEAAYQALRDRLDAEGVGLDAVVAETAFLRRVHEGAAAVRAARARVLGAAGRAAYRPATTLIGQPPLAEATELELSAVAVVPRPGVAASARDVVRRPGCACDACAPGMRARVVRLGDQTAFHAGNVHGAGRNAFEAASDMFRMAAELLAEAGMSFRDVLRTWIHLRDIDRDYAALNDARRAFFERHGIAPRPASTGVQGIPCADAHDLSMSLYAVASPRPLAVSVMSTPSLNEAWTYGADFSRGLRVADANKVALHVSGTASVDEAGRTVHAGDFAAQVERMVHNLASLLARQGATFADVVSGVTYLKHRHDAGALRALFRTHGVDGFPCALVEAPLCRRELLCEAEVLAILPGAAAGA